MTVSEAIKREIKILDYAARLGYTPLKAGSGYTLKEISSISINDDKNVFFRHSTGKGGSIIDFVMEFEGLSQAQALSKLRGMLGRGNDYQNSNNNNFKQSSPSPKKNTNEFILPEKFEGKFSRLYAYLGKERGIDRDVITDIVKRKMLYEEKTHHNAVFVGFDKENIPKYASKRTTISNQKLKPDGTKYFSKGDVSGSSKDVGFYVNNNSDKLFLSEAPIDSMSLMSILKLHNVDFKKYNYLAGGGTSMKSLEYHIKDNTSINKIYLSYDNDEAGDNARAKARALLLSIGFEGLIIDKPPHNKDFNEDLKIIYLKTISLQKEFTKENTVCQQT